MVNQMTTYVKPHRTRASDLSPVWHVIDAQGRTLGRLSTEIATLLQGKHKPTYVSYLNTGDFVVVVNAEKVRVTGKKLEQKVYYRHSGYHGGLKKQTLSELLAKTPTRVIKQAVKGMLPKNTVGRGMLSRLKLYAGESHPHAAQVNARPKAAKAEETQEPASEVIEADTQRPEAGDAEAATAIGRPRAAGKPTEAEAAEKKGEIDSEAEAVTAPVASVSSPKAADAKATKAKGSPRASRKTTKAEAAENEGKIEAEATAATGASVSSPKAAAAKATKAKGRTQRARKPSSSLAASKPVDTAVDDTATDVPDTEEA